MDGIVGENLSINFYQDTEIPEIRAFYGLQTAMEQIHAEAYASLIQVAEPDLRAQASLFAGIEEIPSIAAKAKWAERYMNRERPFPERLVAFAALEGIQFSGSFACVYGVKLKHKPHNHITC